MIRYFQIAALMLSLTFAVPVPSRAKKTEYIFIEATILKMHPPVPTLNDLIHAAPYRPVRYRVERVCKGKYTESEIVVDHYMTTGLELDGVKVGDRVILAVFKSKDIQPRRDFEGVRSANEVVKTFYVGGYVFPATTSPCTYNEKTLTMIGRDGKPYRP